MRQAQLRPYAPELDATEYTSPSPGPTLHTSPMSAVAVESPRRDEGGGGNDLEMREKSVYMPTVVEDIEHFQRPNLQFVRVDVELQGDS
jgi:hypothetical protein